jgi:hypothetical protein
VEGLLGVGKWTFMGFFLGCESLGIVSPPTFCVTLLERRGTGGENANV